MAPTPANASRTHHFGVRRCRQRPCAQIYQHHQQYGDHPLQQLLVGQLDFVRRFDAIRQRHAPRFHQQRRVRQTEAHVTRPFRHNACVHIEYREYGGHFQIHDSAADQRDGEKLGAGHLEHLHLAIAIHVHDQRQRQHGTQHRERQQRPAERPIVGGQTGACIDAAIAAVRTADARERGRIVVADIVAILEVGQLHEAAVEADRIVQRIETVPANTLVRATCPTQASRRCRLSPVNG